MNKSSTPVDTNGVVSRFPESGHDHAACVASAMARASKICAERGRRWTPLRQRVLELVWQSHQPVKAYELLEQLRTEGQGSAAPPTVYRTLDFLLAEGLVHRLASLNAFVGCASPDHRHAGQFLICRHCHAVAELDDADVTRLLDERAQALGFTLTDQTIELEGVCPRCG